MIYREIPKFIIKRNMPKSAQTGICFDHLVNIFLLSDSGQVSYKENLSSDDIEYIDSITTVAALPPNLITPKYSMYVNK